MGDTLAFENDAAATTADAAVSGDDAVAIQSLIAAYFQRTDRPGARPVADLFAPDGALILGPMRVEGREAIAAFFAQRNAEQGEAGRITRHVSGGIELVSIAKDRVGGHSTTLVFAGVGSMPLPSALPTTICDFDDIYVRGPAGWLFQERRASVVFTGAGAASFAK